MADTAVLNPEPARPEGRDDQGLAPKSFADAVSEEVPLEEGVKKEEGKLYSEVANDATESDKVNGLAEVEEKEPVKESNGTDEKVSVVENGDAQKPVKEEIKTTDGVFDLKEDQKTNGTGKENDSKSYAEVVRQFTSIIATLLLTLPRPSSHHQNKSNLPSKCPQTATGPLTTVARPPSPTASPKPPASYPSAPATASTLTTPSSKTTSPSPTTT